MNQPLSAVNALIKPDTPRPGEIDVKPEAEDTRLYGVTTILGALDKPALLYWAAEETAKAAIRIAGTLASRVQEEGEAAVIKYLRDARFSPPRGERSAAELGSAVHAAIEEYALTGIRPEVDDEVRPFIERFDEWAQVWQPEYLAAEAAVYNETYGYAGTLDAIAKIDGQTVILDYKSSRKSVDAKGNRTGPYPEAALQLTAYRHAELLATWRARRFERYRRRYYLLNDDERAMAVPVPAVDGAVVLHLTPEHADLYPVRSDETIFEAFLYTIEIFRWANSTSKLAVGDRLTKGQ